MIRLLQRLLPALLLVAAGSCTSPVEMDNYRRPVVVDPGVLSGQLDNGFRYYLRSANGAPDNDRLELRLVVKAGSLHEKSDERGYAHLVEHMAYRGTRSFSLDSIESLLSDNGLRWGDDVNALTHYGATVYRFSLHHTDEHLVPELLALMAEWIDGIKFEPVALDKEKRIVSAELRERYTARGFVVDPVTVSAYEGSRYANRQPAGDPSRIQSVEAEGLQRFWNRTYRPDNAVLIIAGAKRPWQFEPMIASVFSNLKARKVTVDDVAMVEAGITSSPDELRPADESAHSGVKYFKDGTLVELLSSRDLGASLPSLSVNLISKLRPAPLDVESSVEAIQTRFRSQLLFSAFSYLVRDRIANTEACSAIELNASLLESGQAVEKITMTVTDDVLLDCLSVAFDAVKVVQDTRLTEEEFIEFESLFAQITQLSIDQYRGRTAGELASGLVEMAANGEVLMSAWDMRTILNEVTSSLDADELNVLIRDITTTNRLVMSVMVNAERPAPAIETMIAAIDGPQSSLSNRIRSTVAHGLLRSDQSQLASWSPDYSPGLDRSIASLQSDEQLIRAMPISAVNKVLTDGKYHEWKLENGASVVLLQDDTYDHLEMVAIGNGGYAHKPGVSAMAAKSLPEYLSVNGVNGYTGRSLRKIMTQHQIVVEPYVDEFQHGIVASGSAQELSSMISLTRGYFAEPLVIEPQSSVFLKHLNAGKTRNKLPELVWQSMFEYPRDAVAYERHGVLSNSLFVETHNEFFGSTNNFGFIFVGLIDPGELERELHGLIVNPVAGGTSPATVEFTRMGNSAFVQPGVELADISMVLTCNSEFTSRLALHSTETKNRLHWHWKILTDVAAEKLRYALREEAGFVYDMKSSLPMNTQPLHKLEFSVRPSDIDSVLATSSLVLSELAASGVTERDMRSAVARYARHELLDAENYESLAIKSAHQWVVTGGVSRQKVPATDLDDLNALAQCLSEPLQKIQAK